MVDTSGLLALYRADDPDHAAVAAVLEHAGLLVVSPYVVAELDYLVRSRVGLHAEILALTELCSGAYELPTLQAADLLACAGLVERYADQDIGVTDASLVVLADRYGTHTICTLDRRHFGSIRSLDGQPFHVLP
ncbi:MAG: PIN domain-containing protein [Actinomycetales bacterium]